MLQNEYSLAKIGADTAENGPSFDTFLKDLPNYGKHGLIENRLSAQSRCFSWWRGVPPSRAAAYRLIWNSANHRNKSAECLTTSIFCKNLPPLLKFDEIAFEGMLRTFRKIKTSDII